ncbi:MAG TPA: DUF4249 domain-containing protein [Emticicia sp.]
MKYIIQILLIGITGGLFSCESLVTTIPESKLPKGTEKVVLHAYITPQDTAILVKLTASSPLLGIHKNNGYGYAIIGNDTVYYTGGVIENATIILSDSKKQSVSIPYIKREGLYMLDARQFPIVAGETYTITAETPKGNVEASCTVPKDITPVTAYTIDTLREGGFKTYRINFDWKDLPSQTNYYTMKASINARMLLLPTPGNQYNIPMERIITYTGYWDEENRQAQYQTDTNRDGAVFSTPTGILQYSNEVMTNNGDRYKASVIGKNVNIYLEVLNTDKNYYDYHRAVRINNRQGGNPFVEPVPIPTNVRNGLGCFAASNKAIQLIVF